jgi:hypothetical protein
MPLTYAGIVEAIDVALAALATDAELERRGAGISTIQQYLKLTRE